MATAKEDINTTLQSLLEQLAADAISISEMSQLALRYMRDGNRNQAIGALQTVHKDISRIHHLEAALMEMHANNP